MEPFKKNTSMKPTDTEQMISRKRVFTDSILALTQDGVLVLNSSNLIIEANESAGKLFGLTDYRRLLWRSLSEMYSDPEEADNFIDILSEYNCLHNYENTFIKANRQTFTGSYSGMIVQDSETDANNTIIIIRDISNEIKISEELAQAVEHSRKIAREFDQFTYIIAHDLKAPLRAIANLSEWIQEDIGNLLTDEGCQNFNLLKKRVVRMESMIRGLSEYSKIGKQEVRSESVDVHGLLQEVLNHLSITPTMKVEISQKMPVLIAPKSALFVIFSNLIENAIKHNNKENGCIRIYSDEQSDHFEFTVEDDGPGIAPEYHEKIFALFQTLQSKDKVENIGMGLTLVKRMLEEYGGEIRIESGTVCGSKFIFTWFKNLNCS